MNLALLHYLRHGGTATALNHPLPLALKVFTQTRTTFSSSFLLRSWLIHGITHHRSLSLPLHHSKARVRPQPTSTALANRHWPTPSSVQLSTDVSSVHLLSSTFGLCKSAKGRMPAWKHHFNSRSARTLSFLATAILELVPTEPMCGSLAAAAAMARVRHYMGSAWMEWMNG